MNFVILSDMGGLAILLLSLFRQDYAYLFSRQVQSFGIVTGHRTRRKDDGDLYYAAVIEFKSKTGESHEFVDAYVSLSAEPSVGCSVIVVYPQSRPNLARVPRSTERTAMYVMVFITLAVLLVFGVEWFD